MTKLAEKEPLLSSASVVGPSVKSAITNVLDRAKQSGGHSLSRGSLLLRSTPADWHVMNDRFVHIRETCAPLIIMLGEIARGYRGVDCQALDHWWRRFIDAAERTHKDIGMSESQRAIVRKTALLAYKSSWQQRFSEQQEVKHLTDWSHWLESCAHSKSLSIATLEVVYDFAQTLGPVDKRSARALQRLESMLDGTTIEHPRRAQPSLLKAQWRKAPLWFSGLLLAGVLWCQVSVYFHYAAKTERSLAHHVDLVTKAVSTRPGI